MLIPCKTVLFYVGGKAPAACLPRDMQVPKGWQLLPDEAIPRLAVGQAVTQEKYGKKAGEPKQTSGRQERYEATVNMY